VQQTNRPYNLPAIGNKIADKANRDGVAERFTDPAVQKSIAVDLALLGDYDEVLRDLERTLGKAAKPLYRLRTVPGLGKILSLVLLDDIHDIERFPRVQDFASYGRLVKCAKASAGKRSGTSGTKIGHAPLTGAFSEVAIVCLRENPTGQKFLASLENNHRQGTALTILAHT
jgi:transposase